MKLSKDRDVVLEAVLPLGTHDAFRQQMMQMNKASIAMYFDHLSSPTDYRLNQQGGAKELWRQALKYRLNEDLRLWTQYTWMSILRWEICQV
ncbi:hypothetical protein LTR74_018925, partial [Friedmanniomyces endolithicus]